MRIVYCTNNIEGFGGIEKVTIIKANALAEIAGNKVYIIVTDHKGKQMLAELHPAVTLINLNINYYDDDWKPGIGAKITGFKKRLLHKKFLKVNLDRINPDIAIGTGRAEKFFLRKGYLNNPDTIIVREMHSTSDYRQILARTFRHKLIAKLQDRLDYKILAPHFYDAVVCLTPEDKEHNWKGSENVYVMPNPLTISREFEDLQKRKVVISMGRLSPKKNFSSLINAFSLVVSKFPEWTLEIYGDGPEKMKLDQLIINNNLQQSVFLKGQSTEVSRLFTSSSIFAFTSTLEGFPLVLVEAMSRGIPLVSYDCKYGPSSIISDGIDGFLIKENDEKEFAKKLHLLMGDTSRRIKMGKNGQKKSVQYHPEEIAERWMKLFSFLIENKKA